MAIYSTKAPLTSDTWHHVSFTYNRFTCNVSLLLDNQVVGSADDVLIDLTKSDANYALGFSSNQSDGTSHFAGAMDRVSIYNRELTPDEYAYLANPEGNLDALMKSQLVGHWSFDNFLTTASSFVDKSVNSSALTVSDGTDLSFGSDPKQGLKSVAFEGAAGKHMTADNEALDATFMSAAAWVKPGDHGTTFLEKQGVFSVGTNPQGELETKIGGISTANTPFVRDGDVVPKFRMTFEDDAPTDLTNNSLPFGSSNLAYVTTAHTGAAHDGTAVALSGQEGAVLDMGSVMDKVANPNEVTMSMWINPTELEPNTKYPLMSTNNGFEWSIDDDGTGNVRLNLDQTDKYGVARVESVELAADHSQATVGLYFGNSVRSVRPFMSVERYDPTSVAGVQALKAMAAQVPAYTSPISQVIVDKVFCMGTEHPLRAVNHAYLYVVHSATEGLPGLKVLEDTRFAKDAPFDPKDSVLGASDGSSGVTIVGDFSTRRTHTKHDDTNIGITHSTTGAVTNRMAATKDCVVFMGANKSTAPYYDRAFEILFGTDKTVFMIFAKHGDVSGTYTYHKAINMVSSVPHFRERGGGAHAITARYLDISEDGTWVIITWDIHDTANVRINESTILYRRKPLPDGDFTYEFEMTVPEMMYEGTGYGVAVSENFMYVQNTTDGNGIVIYKYHAVDDEWRVARKYAYTELRAMSGVPDLPTNHTYGRSVGMSHNTIVMCDYSSTYKATIFGITESGALTFEKEFTDRSTGLIDCATWGDSTVVASRYKQGYQLWSKLSGEWKLVKDEINMPSGFSGQWGHACAAADNRYFIGNNGSLLRFSMFEGVPGQKRISMIPDVGAAVVKEVPPYAPWVNLSPTFDNFENRAIFDGTVFSPHHGITKVYRPVIFLLSDSFPAERVSDEYVKKYVHENNVPVQTIDLAKRAIRNLSYTLTAAVDSAGDAVALSSDNAHKMVLLIEEATGEEIVVDIGKGVSGFGDAPSTLKAVLDEAAFTELTNQPESGIPIHEVKWDTVNRYNPAFQSDWAMSNHDISGDGKTMVASKYDSASSGQLRVYQYDDASRTWGKYNPDGSFSAGSYHDLYKNGTHGYYGMQCGISADGKTVSTGGYQSGTSGCLYVFKYNDEQAAWGKYNPDGSFSAYHRDTANNNLYDLGSGTNYGHHYSHYYTHKVISGDGSRVMNGGHASSGAMTVFWDLDPITQTYGKYDSATGAFVSGTPYIIHKTIPSFSISDVKMSADGNTFVHSGDNYAYVFRYDTQRREWGKLNSEGTWVKDDYYDLSSSKIVMANMRQTSIRGTYGTKRSVSGNGNRVLFAGNSNHVEGNAFVWDYNVATDSWGRFGAGGGFIENSPHDLSYHPYCYYGYAADMSLDGNTVAVSGKSYPNDPLYIGKVLVWQFNPDLGEWGKYNDDGSFTTPTYDDDGRVRHVSATDPLTASPHIFVSHNQDNSYGTNVIISGDASVIQVSIDGNNFRQYLGVIGNQTTFFTFDGSVPDYGIKPALHFSGSVTADETNDTTYYAIASLRADLTNEQVRTMVESGNFDSALITEVIPAASGTKRLSKVTVEHVLDENDQIAKSYRVNHATIYLYATSGTPVNDDMSKTKTTTEFAKQLYSVVESVTYDPYTEVSTMSFSMMSSGAPIAKYYTPVSFTKNVDITNERGLLAFIKDNSPAVSRVVSTNTVFAVPALQVDTSYDSLTDPNQTATIDPARPNDFAFFMAVEDEQGNAMLSYPTFTPKITTVSDVRTSAKSADFAHLVDEDSDAYRNRLDITVHDTDWSDEKNGHNGTIGDYQIDFDTTHPYSSFSGNGRFLATHHINVNSGYARVYEYNATTKGWGKHAADGTFTADEYHDLDKSSTTGYYGIASGISFDGNTVAIGGYQDANTGCAFVWQYDAATAAWGKMTPTGFVPDIPHDLSSPSQGTAGCHYGNGERISVSRDGKRVCVGGHATTGGKIFVWDYDEATHTWGGYDAEGAFVENTPFLIFNNTRGNQFGQYTRMSIDGKTIVTARHINTTSGWAHVFKYDDTARAWGKYGASGNFATIASGVAVTSSQYYDLSMSGTRSYYGMCGETNADGSVLLIGGYYDHTGGEMYVWEYDKQTHAYGKYDVDRKFVPKQAHLLEKTGIQGYYGNSGAAGISADGKTVVVGAYRDTNQYYGIAFVWQFDDSSATWSIVTGIKHNTANLALRTSISPESRFIYLGTGDASKDVYIYETESLGERPFWKKPPALTFEGSVVSSQTIDSTSEYRLMATTYALTRDDARAVMLDANNAGGVLRTDFSGKKNLFRDIPNAITKNGTVVPITTINRAHVYLYAREVGQPSDAGYEDLEFVSVPSLDDKPYVRVSMIKSSFTDELTVVGSAFSSHQDIDKVYVLFYAADADLSAATDADLKSTGEANAASVPAMTLTVSTKENVCHFSTNPSKFIDASGAVQNITTVADAYQVRAVVVDAAGQITVVAPEAEALGDLSVPTPLSITMDAVVVTKTAVRASATVATVGSYDYYAIAILQAGTKTNAEVRAMLFENANGVASKTNVTGDTVSVSLSHVVDGADGTLVPAAHINTA